MATRHERVVLDLEDRFSAGMARAAAATALLDKQLNSLSGRAVGSQRALSDAEKDATKLGRSSDSSGRDIDRLSGRLGLLAQAAGAVGPALIPIGAAAVPAIAGLANEFGVAALAGGTAVLAFQGVGTALKALDTYQLEPTKAHLQALQVAMSAVGPAGRDFVHQLEQMKPLFEGIQNTARQGLFPGLTDALQGIATRAPDVNHLVETLSTTLGGLFSEAGQGIEGGALDSFIRTLDTEARPALTELGHSIADVTLGLASLFQAFTPLSLSFGAGMEHAAAGFRAWAEGLSQTKGFHDFVAYIQSTGPKVLELLGALGNDFVQIAEAAAPLGGPVLTSLTALAKVISALADSPLGTPIFTAISALSAYNLALKATLPLQEKLKAEGGLAGALGGGKSGGTSSLRMLYSGLTNVTTATERATTAAGGLTRRQQELREGFKGVAGGAAQLAGVGLVASGVSDKLGLTNTATLGLAGSMAGPLGAGVGVVAGAFLDLNAATTGISHALDESGGSVDALTRKLHDLQAQASSLASGESAGRNLTGFGSTLKDIFGGNLASKARVLPVVGPWIAELGGAKDATQLLGEESAKTQAKLDALNGQAAKGTPAFAQYQQSLRNSGVAAGHTAAEINGMVSAMQANRTAALGAFDAETQYRQALKAAQAQAAKNNAGLRGSSDAVLQNRQALSGLAAAWNNQSDAVRNNVGRYHQARQAFIDTAAAMGVPIAQAKRLADRLLAIPKSVVVKAQIAGGMEALRQIEAIKAQLASVPRAIRTDYYVTQINRVNKIASGGRDGDPSTPFASGGYTGDFPRQQPVGVVHGKEFVFDAVATQRAGVENLYAMQRMLRGYATGGYVGGWPAGGAFAHGWSMQKPPPWFQQFLLFAQGFAGGKGGGGFSYSLSDQSAIVSAQQQVRDLIKQLDEHKKGKNGKPTDQLALTGLDRKAAELNLKLAQQQLRDARNAPVKALRDALSGGFNVDQALGKQPANPVTAGVRDSIAQFKQQVVDAGGTWTKHLQHLTAGMVKHALAIDKDNRALDRANAKHDALAQHLQDLTSQMDSLQSTMSQFGSGVAGNFLSNPFGLGGQSTTFQPTVDNSPALSAATDQLNAAKAHLALLNSNDGSINQRLSNAYAAQGVAGDVARLQAQVDQLSQPVTTTTDALSAFRDTLKSDTQRALDFNSALTTLSKEGLNTDLFSQLAQSGDVGFAQELAAAGQSAVDDINTLWNTRATAAAQVAALATQTVYGQQQAILQGQITRQNALITANQASIDKLNAQVATLGQRVENGAKNGVAGIEAQIAAMQKSIDAIPRQLAHATK